MSVNVKEDKAREMAHIIRKEILGLEAIRKHCTLRHSVTVVAEIR
jgi:hypothetical protein